MIISLSCKNNLYYNLSLLQLLQIVFFNRMYGNFLYFGAKSHNIRRLYWFIIFRVDQDYLAMFIKKCQSLIMFSYNVDLAHCMKMPFMETILNRIICTFGFN